jgi:acyl-CoA thioester hydrolase
MTRPRRSRADYALFESFATRWRDNDVYAHMNNAVYYEYVDSVVNGWLIRTGALDLPDGSVIGLVVETGCVFHASLGFPGRVEAGLRVRRIGRSSVTYEIGLFAEGAQQTAAEAHFTHVCVDRASRRPVALPERLRDALEALRAP